MVRELKNKVMAGDSALREELLKLISADLEDLCQAAEELRNHFCGKEFHLCTVLNAKSGGCTENCKYCAQSLHYRTRVDSYPLKAESEILKEALENARRGAERFSVVTSGRGLTDEEVERLRNVLRQIRRQSSIGLCASLGLLTQSQLSRLKEAGLTRYHNNLETSRRFFPQVCTTHTYDDKIRVMEALRRAGLEICSGGIIGLGESMEDRLDLALELRRQGVLYIPVNILNPIPGTPLEKNPPLALEEIRRTVALFRFTLPQAAICLAGGRSLLADHGRSIFQSGANAAISGNLLTTCGIDIDDDLKTLSELGFETKMP